MGSPKASLMDGYDYIALRLFGSIAPVFARTFELDRSIKRAGLLIHPYLYAARVLLATLVAFLLSLYIAAIVISSGSTFTIKVLALLGTLIAPIIALAIGLSYPSLRADDRRRKVDSELPFLASYLSAMAVAGIDIMRALERIASLRVFDGVRREAQLILRDVRLLGRNPLDAIESNAVDHPSSYYKDFMLGYSASVKIGGNVIGYLEAKTSDIFKSRIEDLKIMSERLALYTELYIILAVIVSVSFYTFFTVNVMTPGASSASLTQMLLFSFIFMPLSALLILYLADRAHPKTPVKLTTPQAMVLSYGVPAALISAPIAFHVTGAYRVLEGSPINSDLVVACTLTLATPLLAISILGAYAWLQESRRARGMGDSIASFLRDLVETRKTGLSPEKSIIVLSTRDYGPLTPIVRRISSSLLLGLDIERAVASATRGYRNWVLLATLRLLTDTITLGGGSVEALDSLARYARGIADFEAELAKRLRVYILMPYIGALMVSGSSMLILAYMAQTTAMTQEGNIASLVGPVALAISLGTTLNSWLMGLVAGKLKNGTILSGFTHSITLTIITIATIAVTLRSLHNIL